MSPEQLLYPPCIPLSSYPPHTLKLQGRAIIVVGGTSGIDFATAEAAVEYGAIVVVTSSKQEKVDRAVERIQTVYPDAIDRIRGKTVDLSASNVEEQIDALYHFATDGNKQELDHIVLTTGGGFGLVPLADVTPEAVADLYKVRMVGCMILVKVAMRYLNIDATSSSTLTSGVSDAKPTMGWTMLALVGAALRGLTYALANELKPVRVNCVCPTAVGTELFKKFAGDRRQGQDADWPGRRTGRSGRMLYFRAEE